MYIKSENEVYMDSFKPSKEFSKPVQDWSAYANYAGDVSSRLRNFPNYRVKT
jgi:hypothetical protein